MRSKYGARATVDSAGRRFDSRGEMRRFLDLELMESAGAISGLRRQVPYDIVVNGQKVCRYIADFVFSEDGGLTEVVEDFKGMRTREYLLKKKLMRAVFGIEIQESGRE